MTRFIASIVLGCLLLFSTASAWALDNDQVNQSIVRVFALRNNHVVSLGSGFVVSQGYVVTNLHVVVDNGRPADRVVVVPATFGDQANAPLTRYDAELVRRSADVDLALLHVPGLDRPPMRLASLPPTQGLRVYAFGFPVVADLGDISAGRLSGVTSRTEGEVTRPPVDETLVSGSEVTVPMIQHSAALHGGNSGGPLVDACGHVVGINAQVRRVDQTGELNVAISSTAVIEFVRQTVPVDVAGGRCDVDWVRDQRVWLVAGVLIALLLAILLVLMLRRGGSSSRRNSAAYGETQPPPLRPAGGGSVRPVNTDPVGARGLVLSGFDGQNQAVRFEFNARELESGVVIGRGRDAQRLLNDERVSRNHARLRMLGDRIDCQDLGSKNGTFVNGQQIQANSTVSVQMGDRIRLGPVELTISRL